MSFSVCTVAKTMCQHCRHTDQKTNGGNVICGMALSSVNWFQGLLMLISLIQVITYLKLVLIHIAYTGIIWKSVMCVCWNRSWRLEKNYVGMHQIVFLWRGIGFPLAENTTYICADCNHCIVIVSCGYPILYP